jgi:hypothetical protein
LEVVEEVVVDVVDEVVEEVGEVVLLVGLLLSVVVLVASASVAKVTISPILYVVTAGITGKAKSKIAGPKSLPLILKPAELSSWLMTRVTISLQRRARETEGEQEERTMSKVLRQTQEANSTEQRAQRNRREPRKRHTRSYTAHHNPSHSLYSLCHHYC